MRRFRNSAEKFSRRVLFLFGMIDVGKIKETPSCYFNADAILSRVEAILEREELFRSSQLSINNLAKRAGTNRTYLSRCFQIKNTSYVSHINMHRLRYAKRLMDTSGGGSKSIAEISELAGFPNPRSFAKCFFEKYGMNPSQYKREILAKPPHSADLP